MQNMTFRNSKIVYYGPHSCENCGALITKMGFEWGGNAFTYPEGPIYPNTEWHPHVCHPKDVASKPKASEPCSAPQSPLPSMIGRDKIKQMVDSFLGWKLPENFNPDGGISFKRKFNENTDHPMTHEPTGTNLLDAEQAEQMIHHMLRSCLFTEM